jgi:hypothetical protein
MRRTSGRSRHRTRELPLSKALVLLEGDALGLSPAGLEWTRTIRDRLRQVAAQEGVDAVYEALIDEVVGEGAWDTFPNEVRRILSRNGPALLAELHYVEEPRYSPSSRTCSSALSGEKL